MQICLPCDVLGTVGIPPQDPKVATLQGAEAGGRWGCLLVTETRHTLYKSSTECHPGRVAKDTLIHTADSHRWTDTLSTRHTNALLRQLHSYVMTAVVTYGVTDLRWSHTVHRC